MPPKSNTSQPASTIIFRRLFVECYSVNNIQRIFTCIGRSSEFLSENSVKKWTNNFKVLNVPGEIVLHCTEQTDGWNGFSRETTRTSKSFGRVSIGKPSLLNWLMEVPLRNCRRFQKFELLTWNLSRVSNIERFECSWLSGLQMTNSAVY